MKKAAAPPSSGTLNQLNAKTLAAAALVPGVGIVELESLVQALAPEIELGTVDVRKALGVDEHSDAVTLEYLVLGAGVVDILQLVGEPGTPGGANAKAQALSLATHLQVARDVLGSFFGQGNGHDGDPA